VEGYFLFSLIGAIIGALLGTRLKMLPTSFLGPIGCAIILGSGPFLYVFRRADAQ